MFADVSAWVTYNPPARYSGVAVADLDGSSRFAVVVGRFDGPNRVLRWAGGRLRDTAPPALADLGRLAAGFAAGDLDGDGREELYFLTADADRVFKCHLDGRWEDLFARPENRAVRNLAAGRGVAAFDRRGVGRYGFFVANAGWPPRLYELGPDDLLADLAPPLDLTHVVDGRGVLAAPLLSDHPDLFCTAQRGPNLVFRNRGDGTFEECAAQFRLADSDEHGRAAAAVDAGSEFALCWGNTDGPHRLMVPQPDGTWRDRATAGLAFPSAVRAVVVADFDNDGHDELFFNNLGEPNRLFRISASGEGKPPGSLPEITMLDLGAATEPDGLGTGAAVADLDGDGVLELVVAHGEAGAQPLGVYKTATAAGNGWLRISPRTRFGAPARGAVVRAEYGGRVRAKVIDGGGYLCQGEPVAHFGLGGSARVERVTVTWPDGAVLTMTDPDVNCTYSVPYPGG